MKLRVKDQYDWIAIGDSPASLLSATLAAKRGFAVLYLPLLEEETVRTTSGDDYLDLEENYWPALGASAAGPGFLSRLLDEAGLSPQEKSRIRGDAANLQVLTRGGRLALRRSVGELAVEIRREYGDAAVESLGLIGALESSDVELARFWANLEPALRGLKPGEPVGIAREVSLAAAASQAARPAGRPLDSAVRRWLARGKTLAECGASPPRELWEGVLAALGYCGGAAEADRDAELFDLVNLLSLSFSGASFHGGAREFRDILFKLARRSGVHCPDARPCRRIFVQGDRFQGVQPLGHGSMISAGGAILGTPIEKARAFFVASGSRRPAALQKAPKPTGWRFTLALTVNAEAIPPGSSSRMTWKEPGAPMLEIEISEPSDYGRGQPGRKALFLRTILPMSAETLAEDYQRLVAARMLRKATELLPFLELHILRVLPEFRAEASPELRSIYGFGDPGAIPASMLAYGDSVLGARSGIARLFLATPESYPELGALGPFVAAVEGVAWLARQQPEPTSGVERSPGQ